MWRSTAWNQRTLARRNERHSDGVGDRQPAAAALLLLVRARIEALEVDAVPAEMSLGPSPTGLRLNGLSKAMFSPRSDASSQQGGTGGNVVVDLEASARGTESR